MNNEIQTVIQRFKEVRDLLKNFDNKEVAIKFLVDETKLSKEECSTAYDIIMKMEA